MMTEDRPMSAIAPKPAPPAEFRLVYCDNRKCRNPVGKAKLAPGSVVSFPCRQCGQRTVVVT
jgi:hypothetical protein